MAIGIDPSVTPHITPPQSTPAPRPIPIQSPGAREKSGADRRQQDKTKGGETFRAALDEISTKAEELFAEAQARRAARAGAAQTQPRAEKLPTAEPAEVAGTDGAELYAQTQSRAAGSEKVFVPSSQEFYAAASRYAERVFRDSSAYAKPGDSVELTA